MIEYPSFDGQHRNGPFYVFNKLDGSQVRAEWSRKAGICKFGRRNGLLDDQVPFAEEARVRIIEKYAESLTDIFRKERLTRATVFFEFYGPSSEFGWHSDSEDHTVTLLDCHVPDVGFLAPSDFVDWFEDIDHAELLYRGNVNQDLIDQVRSGQLPGMSPEGVVCKARHPKKRGENLMFKVKNQEWYDRLKARCLRETQGDEASAERLFQMRS